MAKAISYQAPKYDEEKYRQGIDTSYYTNAVNNYTQNANQQRQTQLGQAQATQQANLRNAYINRMQNERQLANNLATQGIRGGATESSNLKLANIYGQARASANTDYSNSVNTINQNIDQNIRDYRSDMESRAEEYAQNLAQAKWQAERQDYDNEVARQTEYWSTYYTNYYSGMSRKNVQKQLKKLEKRLKNATGMNKIRIEQAISGARARLGVIANK